MVNLYVANTDNDWFDFLSPGPEPTEVNFWRPSSQAFHAIQTGELFAFKLKSPRNKIGGFGVLSSSSVLPLQMAWDTFGSLNGAPSYDALRAAIARYRPDEIVGPTTNIGCRILVEPMFFPSHLWIDLPSSWSRHIQGGKSYSTDEVDGLALWNRLQDTAQSVSAGNAIGFEEAGSPTLGRVLINVQMSGFGGEAEILCSIRALPVLTLKRHAGLRIVAAQN